MSVVLVQQACLATLLTALILSPIDPNVHSVFTQEWMTSAACEESYYPPQSPATVTSAKTCETSRTPPVRWKGDAAKQALEAPPSFPELEMAPDKGSSSSTSSSSSSSSSRKAASGAPSSASPSSSSSGSSGTSPITSRSVSANTEAEDTNTAKMAYLEQAADKKATIMKKDHSEEVVTSKEKGSHKRKSEDGANAFSVSAADATAFWHVTMMAHVQHNEPQNFAEAAGTRI